mgnify:CR=1 FL=1
MVIGRSRLAHGVHGPQGSPHVHSAEIYLRGQYVAESGATGHIAVVDKILIRHAGILAYRAEHGCRIGIGHIFAVGVYLDYRTSAEHRMVGRVVLLRVVGVYSVCVIG